MEETAQTPEGKKCNECGSLLQWFGHGYKPDGVSESQRDGIFRCLNACETWAYSPWLG